MHRGRRARLSTKVTVAVNGRILTRSRWSLQHPVFTADRSGNAKEPSCARFSSSSLYEVTWTSHPIAPNQLVTRDRPATSR